MSAKLELTYECHLIRDSLVVIDIKDSDASEKKFSQSVLQITEMLNIYHAELARILGLQCSDIGDLANGRKVIPANSWAWEQGKLYIELYNELFKKLNGDEVAMYHWLRKKHSLMGDSPLMLMVDERKLPQVVECLKKNNEI
ncbi:MAG: hypothetical protein OQK73_07960 [Gammaproteobacteria bacterium]|nr:hypothetical protein [Gammaproteobacteria bacterium]